jgi:hypothetical protein
MASPYDVADFTAVFFDIPRGGSYQPRHETGAKWKFKGDYTGREYSVLSTSVDSQSRAWHYVLTMGNPMSNMWVPCETMDSDGRVTWVCDVKEKTKKPCGPKKLKDVPNDAKPKARKQEGNKRPREKSKKRATGSRISQEGNPKRRKKA